MNRTIRVCALVAGLTAAALPAPPVGASAHAVQLTLRANVPAVPNFTDPSLGCGGPAGEDSSVTCTAVTLAAIDHARAKEGVGPMVLPSNWFTLTNPEKLFVIADLERTARGLPPYLGLNAALDASAQFGAAHWQDPAIIRAPRFPIGYDSVNYLGFGGTWSSSPSALSSDYGWMYQDGWGVPYFNVDCTSARSSGCWGHRGELLGSAPPSDPGVGLHCTTCEMGTGYVPGSYADLIELPAHTPPPMVFTWAKNVVPYLRANSSSAPLSRFVPIDPLATADPVSAPALGAYTGQVNSTIDATLAPNEKVVTDYNAWTSLDIAGNSINTNVGVSGVAAFTGPIPASEQTYVMDQACAAVNGTAATPTPVPSLHGGLALTCSTAGLVELTWTRANVLFAIAMSGPAASLSQARQSATYSLDVLPAAQPDI